ncbi:hypothetical protein SF83666_c04200 [Sinorhizobium fredii CCBAU 83666]|nr:hypothetical protein SF83666_c04200 [Sinorhizobium fredii CCBAU 83666]
MIGTVKPERFFAPPGSAIFPDGRARRPLSTAALAALDVIR